MLWNTLKQKIKGNIFLKKVWSQLQNSLWFGIAYLSTYEMNLDMVGLPF